MFVKRCKREGMESYFELTTGYDRPVRTRLHLPMACQLRSYAAIWVSRFLREHFADNHDLVAVFRDQILFTGNEHLLVTTPQGQPPYNWGYKKEDVNPEKLDQLFERYRRVPVDDLSRVPDPPRCVPSKVKMSEDNELDCLAERVAAGTSCFIQGIAGTGKTFWCLNTLIPKLGNKSYNCLAPPTERQET